MADLKKGLSVVINTKNEEENIGECIKSVRQVANEIIVVDMASQDKTVQISKGLGAIVYEIEDYGWVEPVRNSTIARANYQWVLLLDADEQIPKTLGEKINEIILKDKYDVVKIPRKDIFFNKWIQHTGWWPDYQIRLFRKGFVTWVVKIHPEVSVKGRVLELEAVEENAIVHYNARSIKVWLTKIDNYTSREKHFEKYKKLSANRVIKDISSEFINRYFNNKGYLDGIHGFILSKFMEFYRFLEFAKYWEKKNYKQLVDNNQLKEFLENRDEMAGAKIEILEKQIKELDNELTKIKSSRFYNFSMIYYSYRDLISKIFTKKAN